MLIVLRENLIMQDINSTPRTQTIDSCFAVIVAHQYAVTDRESSVGK